MGGSRWLLLVMAGLVVLILVELNSSSSRSLGTALTTAPSADPGTQPEFPDLDVAPLSGMQQTTKRPIFRRSRRPPVSVPVERVTQTPEPPPPPPPKPDLHYSLSAVVIAGGEGVAYLNKQGVSELTRLRRGESVDGWRLVELQPDAVVLEHGDVRARLVLRPTEPTAGQGEPTTRARGSFAGQGKGNLDRPGEASSAGTGVGRPQRPRRGPRPEALERALRRAGKR